MLTKRNKIRREINEALDKFYVADNGFGPYELHEEVERISRSTPQRFSRNLEALRRWVAEVVRKQRGSHIKVPEE